MSTLHFHCTDYCYRRWWQKLLNLLSNDGFPDLKMGLYIFCLRAISNSPRIFINIWYSILFNLTLICNTYDFRICEELYFELRWKKLIRFWPFWCRATTYLLRTIMLLAWAGCDFPTFGRSSNNDLDLKLGLLVAEKNVNTQTDRHRYKIHVL